MPAQTVIKLRRDTAANWLLADPVLANGEQGFETDTRKTKVGDGVSAWSVLKYSGGASELDALQQYTTLGKLAPSDDLEHVIYTTPTDKSAVISSITAVNRSSSSQTFSLNIYDEVLPESALATIEENIYMISSLFDGLIKYSTDGISWSESYVSTGTNPGVYYGNGIFLSIDRYDTSSNVFISSDNGLTWTASVLPSAVWGSIAYGNGLFVAISSAGSDVTATSTDGFTWTQRTLGAYINLPSITYGNGLFVLVGTSVTQSSSRVGVSTDGINWTIEYPPIGRLSSLSYGNGIFLSINNNNLSAAISTDGLFWENKSLPSTPNVQLYDTAYGNGLFVIIGTGTINGVDNTPVANVSTDGVTWTQALLPANMPPAPPGYIWNNIAYGGGIFIVSGYSSGYPYINTHGTSTDGITWTLRQNGPSNMIATDVVYGNPPKKYVSPTTKNLYSNVTIPANQSLVLDPGIMLNKDNTLVFKGSSSVNAVVSGVEIESIDKYQMLGQSSLSAAQSIIYKVPEGKTAVINSINLSALDSDSYTILNLEEGSFEPSPGFVLIGRNGDSAISKDGLTWEVESLDSAPNDMSAVEYGNGRFVAVPANGDTAKVSSDGIFWTQSTLPANRYWVDIVHGNGIFVAITGSYSSSTAVSTDGITWSLGSLPVDANWTSVAYGNGIFVAVSSSSPSLYATSTNGITWTQRTPPIDQEWTSVTYGNGVFVAVGSVAFAESSYTAISTDGITWTAGTMPSGIDPKVAFGNGVFVRVLRNDNRYNSTNLIHTSTDGFTWTERVLPFTGTMSNIKYSNNTFIVVSNALGPNVSAISTDGITWSSSNINISGLVKDVVGGVLVKPSLDSYLFYKTPISGSETQTINGKYGLASGSEIRAKSLNGKTTISIFGTEI